MLDYASSHEGWHVAPDNREGVRISFDIDGLDPSIAIGTGSPVPFGLLYEEASAIIEAVANKGSIVGMDMVEISPPCDHQNMTSMYGAQLMLDAMSFLTKARGKMVR